MIVADLPAVAGRCCSAVFAATFFGSSKSRKKNLEFLSEEPKSL